MPTTDEVPQMTVEEGLGPVQLALIEKINKENKDAPAVKTVPQPGAAPAKPNEISFDKPADAPKPKEGDDTKDLKSIDEHIKAEGDKKEKPVQINEGAFDDFLEASRITKEQLTAELLKDHKFKFKMKSGDRELTNHDITSMIGRSEALARKQSELDKGAKLKLGTLTEAALNGDRSALKKLEALMIKTTGAADASELADNLDEEKPDFDEDKLLADQDFKAEEAEFLDPLKSDVDFDRDMGIVQTDLKRRMPEKLWQSYWDSPASRKTMYDLVTSGRVDQLFDAFNKELGTLPIAKKIEVENDSDLYSKFFLAIIERDNLQVEDEEEDDGSDGDDGMDALAGGSGRKPSPEAAPDFLNMPKDEFNKLRKSMNLPPV